MAKKLRVELDVDNAEAKKKVKEAVEAGSSSASPSSATPSPVAPRTPTADVGRANERAAKSAERAASGMDRAERAARNLSNGAEESSRSLKDVARSFAGLGVGMSLRFARQFVEQGSSEDRALGIGESAANLGFMGAKMGGPWGAVIGTVVGAGKGWMESDKAEMDRLKAQSEQRAANTEAIASWQKARVETLAFKATLDKLTDSETALADRQQMVAEEIRKREEAEEKLSTAAFRAGTAIDNSTPEKQAKSQEAFAKAMAKYQENAAKLDQLRELQKRLDKEEASDGAASHGATDALTRVGGYFANGSAGTSLSDLARTGKEQLSVLKKIEAKSGKGATWQ